MCSFAAFTGFVVDILMVLFGELLLTCLGPAGVFGALIILSLVALILVCFALPETSGKALEELESQLQSWKSGSQQESAVSWPVARSRCDSGDGSPPSTGREAIA